jgi:sulfate permease, SulP family
MTAQLDPPASSSGPKTISPPSATGVAGLGVRVLPGLFAGTISGTLVVTFGITLAALIFAGDLSSHLQTGIGIFLLSSAILCVAVSLQSSYKPAITAPQENTSVVLALIAAGVVKKLPPGTDPLPTLIAAFAIATAATGALFLLLGLAKLGKFVRFIPYPVVGGFLAGTGWLIVQGSLSVLAGVNITFGEIHRLASPEALPIWVPGVAFGALIAVAHRRWTHFLLLPGVLVLGIALFYATLAAAGISVSEAGARGWLLGPFPDGGLLPQIKLTALGGVQWSAIGDNAGSIGAITVIAAMSILLNASGLELATEQEIDLDRELRATGIANLASAATGGVVGYLSLSESSLNHKIGARSRLPGFICAALCVLTMVAGAKALSYFPKPVLGGLLFFLGVSFLIDTVNDAFRLPRVEYAVVLLILVVVATVGLPEGIGLGIVISSILFAVNYARIDVIKQARSAARLRSKGQRTVKDESLLEQLGGQIHVLQLQGYLFFGTAYNLLKRVQERMTARDQPPARYVVLDFRHVDGLDSSAVVSFTRMRKLAEASGAMLAFTQLPASVKNLLERGGSTDGPDVPEEKRVVHLFPDLDHGLEWCEKSILRANADSQPSKDAIARELDAMTRNRELVARLADYLERIEAPAGMELYRQGDVAHDLILIESGELSAWLALDGGGSTRLRTMGAGSVVGEAGLYLGQPRSASVRATTRSVLYRLTEDALGRMTREKPELAAVFHQFVARLLSERVVNATSEAQMIFY